MARFSPSTLSWKELPRVVEVVAGKAWIWFRSDATLTPNNPDTTHWLYADNPNATSPQAADKQVFDFADAFSTLDTAVWASQGLPIVAPNGGVTIPDGTSIRSLVTFKPATGTDIWLKVVDPINPSYGWLSAGFQHLNDFGDFEPWFVWISRDPTTIHTEVKILNVVYKIGSDRAIALGAEHLLTTERFPSKAVYRYDLVKDGEHTWSPQFAENQQIRVNCNNGSKVFVHSVRVRAVSDPAPSVSLGAAENHP